MEKNKEFRRSRRPPGPIKTKEKRTMTMRRRGASPSSPPSDSDSDFISADSDSPDFPDFPMAGASEAACRRSHQVFFLLSSALFVIFLCFLRYGDDSVSLANAGLSSSEAEDFYSLLEIPRAADSAAIAKAHRRLAIKFHPDKNKNCPDCKEKFQKISEAYKTLGNPEKRKIYDASSAAFDNLYSEAIDLTSQNFDDLVAKSPDVWLFLVFLDWQRPCVLFQPLFEDLISRYQGRLKFGRIHAHREKSLLARLSISAAVLPAVALFADGSVIQSKAFGVVEARENSLALVRLLEDFYPEESIEILDSHFESARNFLNSPIVEKPSESLLFPSLNTNLIFFPSPGSSERPSVSLRFFSREFAATVRFAQMNVPKEEKKMKILLNSLQRFFGTAPDNKFPKVLVKQNLITNNTENTSKTRWIGGDLRSRLHGELVSLSRLQIADADSFFFNSLCLSREFSCFLVVQRRPRAALQPWEGKFLDIFINEASKIIQSRPIAQFAVAQTFKHREMKKLENQQEEAPAVELLAFHKGKQGQLTRFRGNVDEIGQFLEDLLGDFPPESLVFDFSPVFQSTRPSRSTLKFLVPGVDLVVEISPSFIYLAGSFIGFLLFSPLIFSHSKIFLVLVCLSSFLLPAIRKATGQ